MSRFTALSHSTLSSPAWFVPYDEYARRVSAAGVTVWLDRREDDGGWLPLDDRAVLTPSAALVYPGLGRTLSGPLTPRLHRARFSAPGRQPYYPADGEGFSSSLTGVEFLVHPYRPGDPGRPPVAPGEPRLVRLLPAASFPYPPGVRTVHGVVVRAGTTTGLAQVLVEAEGQAGRDAVGWRERALTDASGAFRLALRWEGEPTGVLNEERFLLRATERPGRTGERVVLLPREAGQRHVIEIRES
ncbi:carboxypeptidase regulatory-like domain-containing protein [Streptomyces sp. NPDC057638]|uniref:carboxypeptidase regulatory-like domain-containing protein n=1 Tax=Streptomyces sp. NPDC057638 TaxID=3346190 RepID=UPI00367C0650